MNAFDIAPHKRDVICRSRADAIALQTFARAIPTTSRFKVRAGLYPDASGADRFKVALSVHSVGLLDGLDAIRALRDYVAERRSGRVYRGERDLDLIGAVTA